MSDEVHSKLMIAALKVPTLVKIRQGAKIT